MNEYLMIMHEVEKARLLTRRAMKEKPSPTGCPPEGHKSMSEREKATYPGTEEDS